MQTNQKSESFCKEIDRIKLFCDFTARAKIFCLQSISLQEHLLCSFFFTFGTDLRSNSLQKRVPEEAACGSFIEEFSAHFFDVARKAAPERITLSTDFTSESKKPSEKSAKKLVRGSLLSELAYLFPIEFACAWISTKLLTHLNPHNKWQQESDRARPAPTS